MSHVDVFVVAKLGADPQIGPAADRLSQRGRAAGNHLAPRIELQNASPDGHRVVCFWIGSGSRMARIDLAATTLTPTANRRA